MLNRIFPYLFWNFIQLAMNQAECAVGINSRTYRCCWVELLGVTLGGGFQLHVLIQSIIDFGSWNF